MTEAAVVEKTMDAIVADNKPAAEKPARGPSDIKTVTGSDMAAIGKGAPVPVDPVVEAEAAEKAAAEKAKAKPKGEDGLNERFSELTQKRKEAEATADAAKAEAAEAKRQVDELRRKYEPPPANEAKPEPQPEQFETAAEYGKAMKEWATGETRRTDRLEAEKSRREADAAKVRQAHESRMKEFSEKNPEFMPTLTAASDLMVHDVVLKAVMESDVGPAVLDHLARNPELTKKWYEMAQAGKFDNALRAFGKLERDLEKAAEAGVKPNAPAKSLAELAARTPGEAAAAPAPITPVQGGATVTKLSGRDPLPKSWSHEDFVRARQAGQIK